MRELAACCAVGVALAGLVGVLDTLARMILAG